ncbi:MAG: tyrosine-type recombinase/integrase, partial [Micromonosporaceae bacterium]
MSALADAAGEYLQLRRLLGHDLDEAHRLLPRFVAYLDSIGAITVTIDAAITWATDGVDPATTNGARRIGIARGFARHMAGIDEHTEIPPLGLIPMRQRWRPPFLFAPADIETLLRCAREIRYRLPAATHGTLLGLLAATGMRVGEALRLEPGDIDSDNAVILIRESKFGKSRLVPILPDTLAALDRYVHTRDRLLRVERTTTRLFTSLRGTEVIYPVVQQVFRRLCHSG